MVEFNHVLLLYVSIFTVLCYKFCRLVQISLHKRSQILLTDTVEFNHLFSSYIGVFFIVLCYKLCRLEQFSLHKRSQILLTDMVEFNHLFSNYIGVFFIILCYKLCRLEQFSLHKTSQILLTDMVEFNHLLFLMYQSIFHSSVLQVVQTSSLLSSHYIKGHKC